MRHRCQSPHYDTDLFFQTFYVEILKLRNPTLHGWEKICKTIVSLEPQQNPLLILIFLHDYLKKHYKKYGPNKNRIKKLEYNEKKMLFLVQNPDGNSISVPPMSKLFDPDESWFTQLSYEDSKDLLP